MPRPVDLHLAASVQFLRATLPPHAPGRDDLRGQITQIMAILPSFADADAAWVEAELRRREAVVARGDALLRGPPRHVRAWVRPAREARWLLSGRNLTWRRADGLPDAVARELDAGTDAVLSALADPRAPGPWARRALLVAPRSPARDSTPICCSTRPPTPASRCSSC